MPDPRDYRLELSGAKKPPAPPRARPFLSVHFKCCGAYARVYRTAAGDAYAGHCPRCARSVRFKVGPGGTDARAFEVG